MKKPWESQRVWFVVIGVVLILVLEAIGKDSGISATHITGLVVALLYGRFQEKANGLGGNGKGPKKGEGKSDQNGNDSRHSQR